MVTGKSIIKSDTLIFNLKIVHMIMTGKSYKFSSWVYNCTLFVREVQGSRIVVSTQKTGAVTGAVDKKYLTKV